MKDQDQLATTDPQLPTKKPNLFYDWWEEMYPRDFLLTFKNYFFNHKKFFDEVFNEQWDDKVKPLAFLFSAIGISLIIGSISPWGLDFSEEPAPKPALEAMLTDTYSNMDYNDAEQFKDAFQLQDLMSVEDGQILYDKDHVNAKIMEVTGKKSPLNIEELQEYFTNKDYTELAARAEYVVLKEKMAHYKYIEETELDEIDQVIILNLFVLWCMLYWLISHRFFKKAYRSSRETVFVFMYGLGMLIFFVYVPFIAIAGLTDDNLLSYSFLVVLVLFLIMMYKIFSIFKYTHNTGFFSLMIVYIKTFLVSILFGLPLLFMRRKKKIGLNK
jgi:hypothetical protein